MAANVQDIESAIMAKLQEALPELSVEAFPENPTEYELVHPLGAVLVQYDGSAYGGNTLSNGVAQIKTLRFAIVTLVRNLRSSEGCYAVLQSIAEALSGLAVPGAAKPVTLISEQFNAEIDGVWSYVQTVETAVRCVSGFHR